MIGRTLLPLMLLAAPLARRTGWHTAIVWTLLAVWGALASAARAPATLAVQLPLLLVTAVVVDVVVMHGYAFLASRAQRWLATARARRAQNRVFGGVLMAMGASLLLVKRSAG
jgi:threonine/homoserine/homoserine lactone efflux protein